MEHMYEEYGALKIISVITHQDWESTEVEPPPADAAPVVNVDEDMLHMLAAGAHVFQDNKIWGNMRTALAWLDGANR